MSDLELERLKLIERRACALRDRLWAQCALLSDPNILRSADDLCKEAQAAIRDYKANRPG